MPPTDTDGRDGPSFNWKRVFIALVVVVGMAAVVIVAAPNVLWFLGRNSDIGPASAFAGFRLPLTRKIITTDASYGPWAAWTSTSGTIAITRSASVWPADRYQRLVTHEYGHALLDDIIASGRYWSITRVRRYEILASLRRGDTPPSGLPSPVITMIAAYNRAPDQVYASKYWRGPMADHFTDSFGEFFAESFSRWRSGDAVEPSVAAALEQLVK